MVMSSSSITRDKTLNNSSDRIDMQDRAVGTSEKADDSTLPSTADASPPRSTEEALAEETVYPKKSEALFIIIGLCFAVFVYALDQSILATAIPKITDEFNSLTDISWYGSAYLLTNCAFQLVFGRLYTYFSVKWVFLSAFATFEIGSLVCATAPSSIALIIGRAIAGLGCAGIFSGAFLILQSTVPLHERAAYSGVFGGIFGIASIVGPLLGGAFTTRLTWRWCFYINLPIGAVTALALLLLFKPPPRKSTAHLTFGQKLLKLDLLGTCLFLPSIICLLLALQFGGAKYPWNDGRVIGLFVVFGILLIIFVFTLARKKGDSLIPPHVLKNRSIAFGAWYTFAVSAAFLLVTYFLPIWFQAVKQVTAINSGIMTLALILGFVVMSIISGGVITAVGYYVPFMILGTVLMTVGAGLMSTFRDDSGSNIWIGYTALFGLGVGAGIQQPMVALQVVLDPADVPVGSAFISFSQSIGGAIFIAVGQSIFSNKLLLNLQSIVPEVDPQTIINGGATDLSALPPQLLDGVTLSYNNALDNVFYIAVAMAALSIIGAGGMEWRSVKERKDMATEEERGEVAKEEPAI